MVGRTKWWEGVRILCILGFGAIDCFNMGAGLVLGFLGVLVVKTLEGFCNVGKHGEVEFPVGVVPMQVQSKVAFSLPIRPVPSVVYGR